MNDTGRDLDGLEELERAVSKGHLQALKKLLESGRMGRHAVLIALPRAIEAESPELVGALISLGGVDPNRRGEGVTAIGYAIENGSPDVVTRLCRLGADPNLAFGRGPGRRPLHLAVEFESMDAMESPQAGYDTDFTTALLEAGADPLLADDNGCNAIDGARGCRHKNAVRLMEKYAPARSEPTIGELRGAATGKRALAEPAVVVIVNGRSVVDDTPLAMSLDEVGQVVLRPQGATAEEAWLLLPNLASGAERPGYSLVNRAVGLALEQPNPSDEVMIGDAPRLKLGKPSRPLGSKRFLWLLRPLDGGGEEQLWAIEDHKHAYSLVAFGPKIADLTPVFNWAWSGESNQRWMIRELTGKPRSADPPDL